MHGILKLQRKVQGDPDLGWRTRYHAEGTEEWPHPRVGTGEGLALRETVTGQTGTSA